MAEPEDYADIYVRRRIAPGAPTGHFAYLAGIVRGCDLLA